MVWERELEGGSSAKSLVPTAADEVTRRQPFELIRAVAANEEVSPSRNCILSGDSNRSCLSLLARHFGKSFYMPTAPLPFVWPHAGRASVDFQQRTQKPLPTPDLVNGRPSPLAFHCPVANAVRHELGVAWVSLEK